MIGVIVYAFAWRRQGDSPCNVRLAMAAKRIAAIHSRCVIIAQRSNAAVLQSLGIDCEVIKKTPGYEGSEQVTAQADALFRRIRVSYVIPVAQPVFQLTKCLHLVKAAGYETPSFGELVRDIGWIGFDPQSVQPQTRSFGHLVYYTTRQILTGYRPPIEQSEP